VRTLEEVDNELNQLYEMHQWMIRNKPSKKLEIAEMQTAISWLEWFKSDRPD